MATDIDEVLGRLREFVQEREWTVHHDPKNLAMLLASEVGELVSSLRWVKSEDVDEYTMRPEVRSALSDELGDIGIAVLLLSDRLRIDLIDAVATKLEKNRINYPLPIARGKAERP